MPLPPAGLRVDDWLLKVSRKEIERVNIIPTIMELGPLLTPENVKRFQRKVSIFVDGYDDDPRDLYEIDVARKWLIRLDIAFPFWFYFITLGPRSSLQWITFGLCRYRKMPEGKMIDPDELDNFVNHHMYALQQLCANQEVSQAKFTQLCQDIFKFYGLQ